MTKRKFVHNLKDVLLVFCAALLSAVSVDLFLLPSQTVVGGGLGIASMLDLLLTNGNSKLWYFSAGIWLLVVNVPILIYCFCKFTRRFSVKTLLYVLFLSAMLIVLRVFDVQNYVGQVITAENTQQDKVLHVVIGGVLHGFSLPIMLSVNASTGGSDIVALIAQRRSNRSSSDVMRLILLTDVIIVAIGAVVMFFINKSGGEMQAAQQAVNMFIYSVAALFIGELVKESIFKGFSSAVELEITTDKPQEITDALQRELKHGVTQIKVVGGYTGQEKTMVLCVVYKRQLTRARKIIAAVDENAFAYVENVKEVIGKGFANKEIELDSSPKNKSND